MAETVVWNWQRGGRQDGLVRAVDDGQRDGSQNGRAVLEHNAPLRDAAAGATTETTAVKVSWLAVTHGLADVLRTRPSVPG